MTVAPFSTRAPIAPKPRPRKKKAPRELVPSDTQARLAADEEATNLVALGFRRVDKPVRCTLGWYAVAWADRRGNEGLSRVAGWSDEEEGK